MERFFKASVTEVSYLDDYENGEIDGTLNIVPIDVENNHFDSLEDVIQWFKERFEAKELYQLNYGNTEPLIIACSRMMSSNGNFFTVPSEEDLHDWAKGKIKVWNVEYQMKIEEVYTMINNDLPNCLIEKFSIQTV